jgi:hypothetical protein
LGSLVSAFRCRPLFGRLSPPDANPHLDAQREPVDDRYQPIDNETSQLCVADPREVGRRNTRTPNFALRRLVSLRLIS